MVEAEISNRRGSYVKAYRHFGSAQPDDLGQALIDVQQAVDALARTEGTDHEELALELLALRIAGLRERLDASAVDVAIRLRRRGKTLEEVASRLHTVRTTISQWQRDLQDSSHDTR